MSHVRAYVCERDGQGPAPNGHEKSAPSIRNVDDSKLSEGEKSETLYNQGDRLTQTASTQRCGIGGTVARVPIR